MAAVWPAGPEPMITSFECIVRVWVATEAAVAAGVVAPGL